jgi:hypothetical protein
MGSPTFFGQWETVGFNIIGFWSVIPCSMVDTFLTSEECAASIFRVKVEKLINYSRFLCILWEPWG